MAERLIAEAVKAFKPRRMVRRAREFAKVPQRY
jgi:hypothetical protein